MIEVTGLSTRNPDWARLSAITNRLAAKDPTLWGSAAAPEAALRLDWVDLPETSRDLLPELDALSAWSRELGHSNFILCGMGGSSLAPEVIATHYGKSLTILDSTDPNQIARVIPSDLTKSCIIIASKSGSTIETAAQRSLFAEKLRAAALPLANHMVVITDPASPLAKSAATDGVRTVLANPKVGGRFSALSAFGLTPAALIGVDISVLLDDAASAAKEFTMTDSSVVRMASYLASVGTYQAFYDENSDFPGLGDWIEQLIAESTGKDGKGLLPVILQRSAADAITFNGSSAISVQGELGAQFIFWEWVTALLCYLQGVDPFNQPNVTEAKERTAALLANSKANEIAVRTISQSIEVSSSGELDLVELLRSATSGEYISVMAYLDRQQDGKLIELREIIAQQTGKPVTFGWGPRFLHSTGQFHKGGPLIGSFIQITGAAKEQIPIPGSTYDFGELIAAQAEGDSQALRARNLPVLQIHLTDRTTGIEELIAAAKKI